MKYLAFLSGLALAATLTLGAPAAAQTADQEAYSGLVIDLGGQAVGQTTVLRVLSMDGRVLYGDTRRLSPTTLSVLIEKRGMASFTLRWKEILRRCGGQPLIVRAESARGSDIVVSNAVADQILQADQRQHFLDTWQVAILAGDVQATQAEVAATAAVPAPLTRTLVSPVSATPMVLAQATPVAEPGIGWRPSRTRPSYQVQFRRPPHAAPAEY